MNLPSFGHELAQFWAWPRNAETLIPKGLEGDFKGVKIFTKLRVPKKPPNPLGQIVTFIPYSILPFL